MLRNRRERRALRTALGQPLPPHPCQISRLLDRWPCAPQIIALEQERDAVLEDRGPRRGRSDDSAACGLARRRSAERDHTGPEAFVRRFANGKALGSYAGLTATPYNSGGMEREQGISKAGNRRLRTVMVELAWIWQRYQPDAAHVRWFRERAGPTGRRMRKVMVVALARKLLIALWRYAVDGVVPEGAVLKPQA